MATDWGERQPSSVAPATAPPADAAPGAPRSGRRERRPGRGTAPPRAVRLHGQQHRHVEGLIERWRRAAAELKSAENAELVRRIFDAFARKQGLFAGCSPRTRRGSSPATESWRARSRSRPDLPLPRTAAEGDRWHVRLPSDRRAGLRRSRRGALPLTPASRNGRALDIDQVLLLRIEDGLARTPRPGRSTCIRGVLGTVCVFRAHDGLADDERWKRQADGGDPRACWSGAVRRAPRLRHRTSWA